MPAAPATNETRVSPFAAQSSDARSILIASSRSTKSTAAAGACVLRS